MSKTEQSVNMLKLIGQIEKCKSSKLMYKLLVQIRTDVVNEDEGMTLLKDKGALKHIVKLLSKPNEKILNVSLSILANCCMKEACREEIVSYGVMPLVVPILKSINQDNIQSRVCRLIGNLTRSYKVAEKFHEYKVVPGLVAVLNNSSSPSTQQMAIRSIRLLWEVKKYQSEMMKSEAIKAVAVHLISVDKDVKSAVIKALASFTRAIWPPISAERSWGIAFQAQGGRSNFELLVAEIGDHHANLCLYNLSCLEFSCLQLIKDGLVEQIVAKLMNNIEHWLALVFCQLCHDPTGRAHVRNCAGGLQLLLRLLQSTNSKTIQSKALRALNCYIYDKTSLEILLMNGLVPALIKNLAEYVVRHGRTHDKTITPPEPVGNVSPSGSGMSPLSRVGGLSPSPWSPYSSPPASPASIYSPLCVSEDELESTPVMLDEDGNIEIKIEEDSKDIKEETTILSFLNHISSYLLFPIADFVTKITISTLIDYISLVKDANPIAGRLLGSIAGNKMYYKQLLDDQFVQLVHCGLCRPNHLQCTECQRMLFEGTRVLDKMSQWTQTGLGEGEITYRLLKAEQPVKLKISLLIPHVISDRKLLLKLLFKSNAIDHLMDALRDNQVDAISSFQALFKTLKINNPQQATAFCSNCNVGSLRKEGTITFVLDDGSSVSANKSSLCNNSPVFEAMFRGGFEESDQAEVKLKELSATCVTHFFRILDNYCECILPKDIKTLLELIVVSDRFIVPEFMSKIYSVVINHVLSYKNCGVVYSWAHDVGYMYPMLGNVNLDVIKFAFTSEMTQSQRIEAFSFMLSCQYKKELLEDILNMIKDGLFD